MTIYRGFSTRLNAKKYSVTDFALAKQDMINHFEIRKGEKLMNPQFGSIIWDMLFEPLTEDTKQISTTGSCDRTRYRISNRNYCELHTHRSNRNYCVKL
jgi:hypothetical protein